jgi:hypothetical protein
LSRFEYRVTTTARPMTEEALQNLGRQGWELTAVQAVFQSYSAFVDSYAHFFKREAAREYA